MATGHGLDLCGQSLTCRMVRGRLELQRGSLDQDMATQARTRQVILVLERRCFVLVVLMLVEKYNVWRWIEV